MDEEIRLHRSKLEKSVAKKDVKKTLELLRALDNIPMTLDVLSSTQIGAIVNKARRTEYDTDATELVSLGRRLVKRWKGQLKDRQDSRDNSNANNNINSNTISSQSADKTNLASSNANRGENGNQNHLNNGSNVNDSNDSSKQPQGGSANAGASNADAPTRQQQAEQTSHSEPKPSTSSSGNNNNNNVQRARAPVQTEVTQTTDCVRLTIRKQLTEALKVKLPQDLMQEPFLEEEVLAARIEESIYQEFKNPNDSKYRNRCRSRVSNLRDIKNPYLRYNVLRGFTTPERLAKMTAEEMASDELKKEREKFTKESIIDHQMAFTQGAQSSEIKCPACKKYNCTYNQMQTRSADEPMTTFCHCNECGKRWKFC